jgi:hypothetical protein
MSVLPARRDAGMSSSTTVKIVAPAPKPYVKKEEKHHLLRCHYR